MHILACLIPIWPLLAHPRLLGISDKRLKFKVPRMTVLWDINWYVNSYCRMHILACLIPIWPLLSHPRLLGISDKRLKFKVPRMTVLWDISWYVNSYCNGLPTIAKGLPTIVSRPNTTVHRLKVRNYFSTILVKGNTSK